MNNVDILASCGDEGCAIEHVTFYMVIEGCILIITTVS